MIGINISSFFFKILNPPKHVFEDFFIEAKYILTYRISLMLALSFSILLFVTYTKTTIFYTASISIAFISVLLLAVKIRKTGNYIKFASYFNIIGAILCIAILFGTPNQPHIADGFWMIINIIFAFYTLNKNWAAIITFLHTISFTLFFYFNFEEQLDVLHSINRTQITSILVNAVICLIMIFLFFLQNNKTTKEAQKQISDSKIKLQYQFDTINKQNLEKTILIKEIHHRVKNNLQVIISLLRLQSRELENDEAIDKFKNTISRVITMALIHEKMYKSEDLAQLNLDDYFNGLLNDILDSYIIEINLKKDIVCRIKNLDLKSIVPIALIFNELFSNSLKYAFNSKIDASIKLHFHQNENNEIVLEYSDNGLWREPIKKNSFGLELIEILTEQLEGTMEFSHSPVTQYIFKFKK